jgi:hypothetical protein
MNASLTANRVWPLVLLLAAIVLLMHATQSASGAEPAACQPCAKPASKSCCLPTWCQGCVKPRLTCDDYCRKQAPCVQSPDWCGLCPDYCRKCLPEPPCCAKTTCVDDYCRKPCPVCPVLDCSSPCKPR